MSNYREIGFKFQGANTYSPYWIVLPETPGVIPMQVGNVVSINSSSAQCGISLGLIEVDSSINKVTNKYLSLLCYTVTKTWNLYDNCRYIEEVWLRK